VDLVGLFESGIWYIGLRVRVWFGVWVRIGRRSDRQCINLHVAASMPIADFLVQF